MQIPTQLKLALQALHSSGAILQLFQAGEWDIQQRLVHSSQPFESMSFAAVHTACSGLGKQIGELLRDPVVVLSSKVFAEEMPFHATACMQLGATP